MKMMKKLMAFALAAVMTVSMGMSALADETPSGEGTAAGTYTITINKDTTDKAAHTYGAFQIFTGRLETVDGKDVLSDIQWGSNVDTSTAITELKKITDFRSLADDATAIAVAKAISDANLTADSATAQAIADAFDKAITGSAAATGTIAAAATQGSIEGLAAGYYLVKDTEAITGEGAYTRFILEVVKDVVVTEKANIPSVSKKVKETNDTTGDVTGWQDAADYDIGDSIPYKLEGTLPGKFEEFDTFTTYTFTDVLSKGLTPPAVGEVKVTLDTETGTEITDLFNVTISGQTITIGLKQDVDLRTDERFSKYSKIIVTYNAVLNENAKLGYEGNPNEVDLEFSNNPNYDGTGTGKTPKDKVIVFTYDIKALKVKADGNAIDEAAYEALTEDEKKEYIKVGDKYQKTAALEGAGFTLYKKVPEGTEGAVDGYLQIGDEITGVTTFDFKGADAGEYKLVETTVPAGYNKAEDLTFTVTATYDTDAADPELKNLTVTPETAGFVVTSEDITGKILNESGAVLPSTGGAGTTLFYIIGSILVIGAGVILVTRRRMNVR